MGLDDEDRLRIEKLHAVAMCGASIQINAEDTERITRAILMFDRETRERQALVFKAEKMVNDVWNVVFRLGIWALFSIWIITASGA